MKFLSLTLFFFSVFVTFIPLIFVFWRRFIPRYLIFSTISSLYLSVCVSLGIIVMPFKPEGELTRSINLFKKAEYVTLGRIDKEPPPEWMAVKALGIVLNIEEPEAFLQSILDPVLRERIKFLMLGLIEKDEMTGQGKVDVNEALSELNETFGLIRGKPLVVESHEHLPARFIINWLEGKGGFVHNGVLYIQPTRFIEMLGTLKTPFGEFVPDFEKNEKMIILKLTKK